MLICVNMGRTSATLAGAIINKCIFCFYIF
jgi:hypothetical protein